MSIAQDSRLGKSGFSHSESGFGIVSNPKTDYALARIRANPGFEIGFNTKCQGIGIELNPKKDSRSTLVLVEVVNSLTPVQYRLLTFNIIEFMCIVEL